MLSKLVCTDVLAIRCLDNFILVGMGCVLYIYNVNTYKLNRKIYCLYPYNIHGIVDGPNNKLTVFGANFFRTYKIYDKQGILMVEEESNKIRLNDWIIAAKWLMVNGRNNLCILLAHNNVCIYDPFNDSYQNVRCEEKCILYGGSIFINNNKDLIIFSGTVYQEILIWEVNNDFSVKTSSVLHRLQGHNGVIFSVVYDPITQLICSTSDDRTVRLWKISNAKNNENHIINWKEVDIKLMRTMFGHTARVWKSIIRNETLITIGEDSFMCIWSLDGKLLSKMYAHHGAAIWSIDVSDDNKSIFTGGADGAVHAWPFITDCIQKAVSLPKRHIHSLPKYVCYLESGNLLIFTEDGIALIFDKDNNHLLQSLCLKRYSSYCVMQVSLCHSYVCFASREGYITIFKETEDISDTKLQEICDEKIMESQVLSVHWLESTKLVACGINGILKIFSFTVEGSVAVNSLCLLPPSRERWLTAAVLYDRFLICGDRAGNMHIFKLDEYNQIIALNHSNVVETNNKPIQTFAKVHGKIGIQTFIVLNSKLVSAGRDGILKFYELSKLKSEQLLYSLHKEKMPMDWISKSLKTPSDILILGFKEMEFVIYSMLHHRTLLRVSCGGGHRSWDCMLLNELITFLYIRNKQVYISDIALSSLTLPVLLNGFHTKEINCINPILKGDLHNIFISGGEDGTIRVAHISDTLMENNFTFRTLGVYDGHISSVKFITCCNLQSNSSCNKSLVFSGGGRAQIKVWEIDIKGNKSSLQSTDISCHDVTSHMLYGPDRYRKKQWQESNQVYISQPDTRYMDIDIYRCTTKLKYVLPFVACADGFVRIFLYDIRTKHIALKLHIKCANRCITKITVLTYEEKIIALVMSTDGIGQFIDFTDIVSQIIHCPETKEQEFQSCKDITIAKFNLHQSGINSYDIKMIRKGDFLLATGGDDNSLNLTRFQVQLLDEGKKIRISLLSRWSTFSAHAAQITGILFHEENKILSVGMDQQLIAYCYNYDKKDVSVTILTKVFTFVTDVKGLTTWYNSKGETVTCIYGNGFEVLVS